MKVVVLHPLPEGGLDPLAGHDVAVTDDPAALAEADALICLLTDRIDAATLDACPRLRAVATVSVGYDNVDVDGARQRGIAVLHTPGVLDETTADLAFALLLMAARRLGVAERELRAGRWAGWDMTSFLGRDVTRLGLVGYGRTGRAMARRAAGFGMEVRHHTRGDTGVPGWTGELDQLLGWADAVSLHVPLTPETRGLVGARELALMQPSAVLVNTARGPVVDEVALAAALREGRLFGAGLDVYSEEPAVHPDLLAAPNLVLLPHVGSATVETRTAMAALAAEGVRAVLAGETPPNLVPR